MILWRIFLRDLIHKIESARPRRKEENGRGGLPWLFHGRDTHGLSRCGQKKTNLRKRECVVIRIR